MTKIKFHDIDFAEVSASDRLNILQQLLLEMNPLDAPPTAEQIRELARREAAVDGGNTEFWVDLRRKFIQ